jgi:hypothetical protein
MKYTQWIGLSLFAATRALAASATGPDNIVLTSNSTKCLDIVGSSASAGADVEINTCNASTNSQKFVGTLMSGVIYQIQNEESGLCVDVASSSKSSGAKVVQSACSNSTTSQQWSISEIGSTYQFKNVNSGLCLDLTGGVTTNGTVLEQTACGDTNTSQIWDIAASAVAASPSGTTIPSGDKIFDSAGDAWTLTSGVVLENGADVGYTANVSLVLYYKGKIYQENSSKDWWSWTSGAWVAVSGDPRVTASPSPSPSAIVTPKPSPSPSVTAKPTPSPTPSPTVSATPSPNPSAYNIGMNLPPLNYYNDAAIYADVFNQTAGNNGRWDVASPDAAAPVDSTGAPTVDAWTGFTNSYPTGTYSLSWDGTGSISMPGLGTAVVTTVDGVEHHVVPVSFTQNRAAESWTYVTATVPVTNIHMTVPSTNQVSGSVFTKDFLAKIQPYSNFRFMDALQTNGNPTVSWSQRTLPTAGSRSGTMQGMAYEDIVELANETGRDVWINVPTRSTDDYVCRMARLFLYGESGSDDNGSNCSLTAASAATSGEVGINSKSKIHLEYSNETWNWAFQQTNDLYCMANGAPPSGSSCQITKPNSEIAIVALANKSLPWAGSSNLWYNGSELSVVMTKRGGDIFKTVFGSRSSQIKVVQNVQSAYAAEIDPAFQFMKAGYGALSGYIDYMAVAPYADVDSTTYEDNLTDLFADLNDVLLPTNPNSTSGNSIYQWIQSDLAEANEYGLSLVAYEGGQGLTGNGGTIETTAQSDPRMYTFYKSYFAVWDKLVGRSHLFNQYNMAEGTWGALVSTEDPGSEKWDALLSLILTPGDANGDASVNQSDCAIVQANWGRTGMWWSEGDFNHDGTVNADDLALLNAHISGAQCTAP